LNAGFISYILIVITLILISFGWKTHTLRQISLQTSLFFIILWVILSNVQWSARDASGGTFVFIAIAFLLFALLWKKTIQFHFLSMFTFSLLLCTLCVMIQFVETIYPMSVIFHSDIDPLVAVVLLILLYSNNITIQIIMVSITLVLVDIYWALLYMEWSSPGLGSRYFQDKWWVTMYFVRISSASSQMVVAKIRSFCYDKI